VKAVKERMRRVTKVQKEMEKDRGGESEEAEEDEDDEEIPTAEDFAQAPQNGKVMRKKSCK